MGNFQQQPSGNVQRDIRALFDWMRAVHGTNPPDSGRTTRIFVSDADTLDSVSDRGATTDKAITVGNSVTLQTADGKYSAVISINTATGRLEAAVNGRKQQSW
jgi:hypothetical protein